MTFMLTVTWYCVVCWSWRERLWPEKYKTVRKRSMYDETNKNVPKKKLTTNKRYVGDCRFAKRLQMVWVGTNDNTTSLVHPFLLVLSRTSLVHCPKNFSRLLDISVDTECIISLALEKWSDPSKFNIPWKLYVTSPTLGYHGYLGRWRTGRCSNMSARIVSVDVLLGIHSVRYHGWIPKRTFSFQRGKLRRYGLWQWDTRNHLHGEPRWRSNT